MDNTVVVLTGHPRGVRARRKLTGGPGRCNSVLSDLFKYFSNRFEMI
jgi:hypothetical protein